MKREVWQELLDRCLDFIEGWRRRWPAFEPDSTVDVSVERLAAALDALFQRLSDTYPFFHPLYAGQMLKPPHPVAILAYFTALHMNPNNHALDGGPATSYLEKEAVAELAALLGWTTHLGHLASGGTVANLEALWVARETHPDRWIAFSAHAHYTHRRACELLRVPYVVVDVDERGRMDPNHLETFLRRHPIGTVVVTVGTTGLGAIDPVHEILALQTRYGFRIHADAAYGGFFSLLAQRMPPEVEPAPFQALPLCDSVVIDPHKHGLQPYGCGCVLFRDPTVGRFYKHDSPYTYFTSPELHLGEISLECSRPGAAAAALWATLRCFPLRPYEGLGPVLSRCRMSALEAYSRLQASDAFRPVLEPELDIVTFLMTAERRASRISAATERLFETALRDDTMPVYLSKLRLDAAWLKRRFPDLVVDQPEVTVLRSVLMKPEHATDGAWIWTRLEAMAERMGDK
ncbi:MAG: aminotransferase class I/II-fold pyridoxal phosphate-dependent enzyme [Acidobacteria bacterium]|nr:aminotransferase class I/II-fold pyridoxal phosphate-dependent enzyme [Acidobacteriota bacterium]MDW7983471.1 aminotransferase class I/II-fold pyridoxal phosphate-dependent enzyme [Acidobacteriota bacterium]